MPAGAQARTVGTTQATRRPQLCQVMVRGTSLTYPASVWMPDHCCPFVARSRESLCRAACQEGAKFRMWSSWEASAEISIFRLAHQCSLAMMLALVPSRDRKPPPRQPFPQLEGKVHALNLTHVCCLLNPNQCSFQRIGCQVWRATQRHRRSPLNLGISSGQGPCFAAISYLADNRPREVW